MEGHSENGLEVEKEDGKEAKKNYCERGGGGRGGGGKEEEKQMFFFCQDCFPNYLPPFVVLSYFHLFCSNCFLIFPHSTMPQVES